MIDAAQIDAVADALDGTLGDRGSADIGEWFSVREVDELAVVLQAVRYGKAGRKSAPRQGVDAAFVSVFILGFRIGLEVERDRRDRQELPA